MKGVKNAVVRADLNFDERLAVSYAVQEKLHAIRRVIRQIAPGRRNAGFQQTDDCPVPAIETDQQRLFGPEQAHLRQLRFRGNRHAQRRAKPFDLRRPRPGRAGRPLIQRRQRSGIRHLDPGPFFGLSRRRNRESPQNEQTNPRSRAPKRLCENSKKTEFAGCLGAPKARNKVAFGNGTGGRIGPPSYDGGYIRVAALVRAWRNRRPLLEKRPRQIQSASSDH